MKTFALWTLVAVNAALAVGVAGRLFRDDRAQAQMASNRDEFLMIPGEIVGGTNAVVYVIDETTHQMSSMSYDDSMRQLNVMNPRDLQRDFAVNPQGNGNGNGRR